jgi:hypothetical protein
LKSTPNRRIGGQGLHATPGHVDESAMVCDQAMPEKPSQERERVIGKRRIYEWLLSLSQRFFAYV